METSYTVDVTKEDIERAILIRGDGYTGENTNITTQCPIALAFQRVTGRADAFWAYATGGFEEDDFYDGDYHADKALETMELVKNFDNKQYDRLAPLTFIATLK